MGLALSNYAISGESSNFFSEAKNQTPFDLYAGSGGQLIAFFSVISGREELATRNLETKVEIYKIIDYITSCFDLTKEELALVCRIQSRKTIYNWKDGTSSPRAETLERLFDLFMIAEAWRQTNLPNDRKLLNRPVLDDESILDMLKADILSREKILFAGARLVLLSPFNKTKFKDPFA